MGVVLGGADEDRSAGGLLIDTLRLDLTVGLKMDLRELYILCTYTNFFFLHTTSLE